MNLYVTRHGQTDMNIKKLLNGCRSNEDINSTGILQAKQTAEKLKDKKIDLIITSPMKRTKQTAELINLKNVEIIEDKRIIDLDLGEGTFKSYDYMTFEEYYDLTRNESYKDIENIKNVFKRVEDFLNEITKKYIDKNVLIVTHAGIAKVIHAYFNGIPENNNINQFYLDNCEVRKYEIK